MGYSSEGYGVFHCGIWGIPLLDMGYSNAGYGVFHCGIWDMLLIGSDIAYIEMEDIHSYLDEIFPKLNTQLHNMLLCNLCCFVLSWVVLFWGRWVSWVGLLPGGVIV